MYFPHVRYEYRVDGSAYISDRITVNDFKSSSRKDADAIVAQFQNGSPVSVFFNPKNPSQSLLQNSWHWTPVLFSLTGLVFVVIGVVLPFFETRAGLLTRRESGGQGGMALT